MNVTVISKLKEMPKTRTSWHAMWLGLGTISIFPVLGIFGAVTRQLVDPESVNPNRSILGSAGFLLALCSLALSVSALVTGIKAYKLGERTFVLWAGFVPAMLVGLFWIFMITGELLFPH